MTEPPQEMIELAVTTAGHSPCAKSKRGVVVFRESLDGIMHEDAGFNGPPYPFECGENDACRAACGQICVHAEARAIRRIPHRPSVLRESMHLLHVKAVDGKLVPGGGPSCVQCSREILDSGKIGHVWLFEAQRWTDTLKCHACYSTTILAAGGHGIPADDTKQCVACGGVYLERSRAHDLASGEWKSYDARDFHEITLENLNLPTKKDHYP